MRRLGRLSAATTLRLRRSRCRARAARAFDPALEAKNFAKVSEREAYVTGTPAFQTRLQQQNVDDVGVIEQIVLNDPDRNPFGNICSQRKNECAGDVRFYDWEENGYGVTTPVLFTGRSGANISGTVWTTLAGPAQRPAIVMTTGSVQAPETLYWGLAAVYAKAGYVVLTYDVQGQGRSDTFGKAPDEQEGVPSQAGQPFFDGTEDALDFLLSTPGQPYDPRPSCGNANGGTGTDHSPKHDARVAQGFTAAFNPTHSLVDPARVGHHRPLARRRRRLLRRAGRPAGRRARRIRQPALPDGRADIGHPAGRCAHVPLGSRDPGRGAAQHEARARDLERLRADADAVHVRPGPGGQERRRSRASRPARTPTRCRSTSAAAPTTSPR